MIFLMFNMGNSGGSWFERVCNSHEDILVWEELHRQLGYIKANMEEADLVALEHLKRNENRCKSIGLIKSFGKKTVEYCLSSGGNIVQMFRNPIKVVNHKMGKKLDVCRSCGIDCEDVFEAHVIFYSMRYNQFIKQGDKYPIYKLEDMSDAIINGRFRGIIESITGVEWNDKQIKRINKILPNGKNSFKEDRSENVIWNSWDDFEKEVFIKHFKPIMNEVGYKIPL